VSDIKRDFSFKIDTNLTHCNDEFLKVKQVQTQDRSSAKSSLLDSVIKLQTEIHSESENIKSFVTTTTARANQHRENL